MKSPKPALAAGFSFLLLAGCNGAIPPAQPTLTAMSENIGAFSVLAADPMTVWSDNDYFVRAACHAYLNQSAARNANLNFAGVAVGVAGAGASMFNPLAGVGSSLAQSFLSSYQASGAIPYTADTAILIENALDGYEDAVSLSPPMTVAEAASDVDTLWWQCSPGGYAELAAKSLSTATITSVSTSAPVTAAFSARAVAPRGRPKILVNGH